MFPGESLVHLDLLRRDGAHLRAVEEEVETTDCRTPAIGVPAPGEPDAARTRCQGRERWPLSAPGLATVGWSIQLRAPTPGDVSQPRQLPATTSEPS